MPGFGAGQDRRRYERDDQKKPQCQQDAFDRQRRLSRDEIITLCVAEQKLADKGTETGREHAYMEVLVDIKLLEPKVKKRRKETGQHVQQV